MKFERDPKSPDVFVDTNGFRYPEYRDGLVGLGDVSRQLLGKQAQYISRLVGQEIGDNPRLGNGLRITGEAVNYHSLSIHPEDVREFLARYHAYTDSRLKYVYDQDGSFRELTEDEVDGLQGYLESVGAIDAEA